MKIRMYMDLYGGLDPSKHYVSATNTPGEKTESAKRIAFDVTIPDALLFSIDGFASEVSAVEVVK